MTINQVIKRIGEETGLVIHRHTVYHYDKRGLLFNVVRKGNGYRKFNKSAYEHVKVVAILSDLGIEFNYILKVLEGAVPMQELVELVQGKNRNSQYIIDKYSGKGGK